MKNPLSFDGFIQIAIVVQDIQKAAETWARFFNIPVPEIRYRPPAPNPDLTYRGKPAEYGLKLANIEAGPFVIELHEPDERDSTFREFLDKHGNGVHHLGFQVGKKRDAIVGELEEMGYAMRTIGYYPGSSWTIVDSEDDLGVNLNIKPRA
ncbi:Glyoxalase/Bleomycin resistance protein/Dioxygenase superfamily protein [Cohnella sp. OV330]|uniref:VOC family protein n=1 Tax=Cohnella sp. OV330 TaxID=1855288 RepID=UPI0008EB2D18|nr:VOC family protein [Cohnella sp. OV330]SFB49847.1 Glyoxalase/Bleomycin resistance protein/Dioxygenase superfamily protein [Cohnella sp. OV330]